MIMIMILIITMKQKLNTINNINSFMKKVPIAATIQFAHYVKEVDGLQK